MKPQIVIGGGSWGMAIATALAAANTDVGLFVRNPETVRLLAKGKCRQLPDQPAVEPLAATLNPDCLSAASMIYVVVPAGATQDVLSLIKERANPEAGIIFAAKGLVADASSGGRLLPELAWSLHFSFRLAYSGRPPNGTPLYEEPPEELHIDGANATL